MGDSVNDKLHAAYTDDADVLPKGGVRIAGTVATTGGSSSSPVVQPVSISSGFPVVQPVSITSGFPVTQAVNVADGADVAEGMTTDAPWVAGNGTVISLLKKIASAGGSAVSIADGADIVEGSTADAAVITDASGTLSGKFRGLIKIFADVWDSSNHWIKVSVQQSAATGLQIATGSNTIGTVSVSNFPASQPITGTVTLGTGTNIIGAASTGTNQLGILPGQVATSNPGASTHTFLKNPMFDKVGRQVTIYGHVREMVASTSVRIKGSAETGIIGEGGLGVFNDLACLTITSTFTSPAILTIRSVLAGATSIALNYPNANAAPGSPMILYFQPPIPQTTANSQWTVTQSAATMAAIYNAVYIKNI